MTFKTTILGLALIGATAWATHTTTSQDGEHAHGDASAMEEMMKMIAAGMPGEQHGYLAETVGSWDIHSKHWMDAEAPPSEGPASSEIKMILGGRFMHETFKMDFGGMPFEGNLIMGYNNITEEYESIWIDNMTSGMSRSTGQRHADGSFEFNGTMVDLRTPEGRPYRMTTAQHDDGTVTFKMYDTGKDGKELLVMENHYTRRGE